MVTRVVSVFAGAALAAWLVGVVSIGAYSSLPDWRWVTLEGELVTVDETTHTLHVRTSLGVADVQETDYTVTSGSLGSLPAPVVVRAIQVSDGTLVAGVVYVGSQSGEGRGRRGGALVTPTAPGTPPPPRELSGPAPPSPPQSPGQVATLGGIVGDSEAGAATAVMAATTILM